jgi:hypothetical protein
LYFIKGCQHRLGYKFPEVYLVPTLFLTPEEKNSHNSINKIVNRSKLISFRSIDYNNNTCTRLKSNEAIVSENGRFKLILEDSGNLIIKDDVRTMWESVSGYIIHSISPYYLQLTPMCQLKITSKNGYVVWFSASRSELMGKCYIDFDDLNNGRLVVRDSNKTEVWQSWPNQDNNLGITLRRPFQHKYVPCDGEPYVYIHSLNIDTQLNSTESLTSQNGLWDVIILRSRVVLRYLNVIKSVIFKSNRKLNSFIFKFNGILQINAKNVTYEYKYFESKLIDDLKQSKLFISNHGDLSIIDKSNVIFWELKLKDANKKSLSDFFKLKNT